MAAYPTLTSDDPDPDAWKEGITEDPTIRSNKRNGMITTRARFTRVPRTWEFAYKLLSDADRQVLQIFERETAKFGAVSFDWINFRDAYGAPDWTKTTAYTAGKVVKPVTANGRSYRCTTAGTSGATEPTWPTTKNATVADGDIVWTENTHVVKFAQPIQFNVGPRIDLWEAVVSLMEVL